MIQQTGDKLRSIVHADHFGEAPGPAQQTPTLGLPVVPEVKNPLP
ncbi:hypothetical protein V8V91_21820 [Algoriphagus halophilus]